MGHYSPPLHDGADASLADGYVAPAGAGTLSINAVLSDAGKFAYKFSSNSTVDTTLRSDPAYSPPEGDGTFNIAATLRRPLADMGYTSLYPVGFADGAVPDSHSAELKNRVVFAAGFATQEFGGSGVRHVSRPLRVKHTPIFLSSVFIESVAAPSHDGIKAILRSYGNLSSIGRPLVVSSIYSDVIFARGISAWPVSHPSIRETQRTVRPNGWDSCSVQYPYVTDTALRPVGIRTRVEFGTPVVFNWDRYIPYKGFDAQLFGTAYVQGGVKTVRVDGSAANLFGTTAVINTTANQTAKPWGIEPPVASKPFVSPQTLWPFGFIGLVGIPMVQRNPSPKGFELLAFGYPTVIDRTRYLRSEGFDALSFSYPRAADKARKVLHKASTVTSIFGDVAARLKTLRVQAQGLDSFEGSPWGEVRSTRRSVVVPGAYCVEFGASEARNKTPSLSPAGLQADSFGAHHFGARVRVVYVSGVSYPSQQVAKPSLWKTPSLQPNGLPAPALPTHVIGHGRRELLAAGNTLSLQGKPTVAFRYRKVVAEGFGLRADLHGVARLEHGRRTLPAGGQWAGAYGTAWVSASPRVIAPDGIETPRGRSLSMVGGRRWLGADGFVATRFGARIIPERLDVYVQGFAGVIGLASVLNTRRHLPVIGITTYPEEMQRYGTAAAWNRRQYVRQEFDVDSALNPPAWSAWTAVANRNRFIGAVGALLGRVGEPAITNGARAILPAGAVPPHSIGVALAAYRVRSFSLEGMEPPITSRWAIVVNKAAVLRPAGLYATAFGRAAVETNRRFITYAGGMDVFAPGNAFAAPRIRGIDVEKRYAIAPPYIIPPGVQLATRYVDAAPNGIKAPEVGRASLHVVWRGLIPRWSHKDYFGEPRLHNVTPELLTRGRESDEHGQALVRLEWRPVVAEGLDQALFGPARIADRLQRIGVSGTDFFRLGDKLKILNDAAPPQAPQRISLVNILNSLENQLDGDGISPPGGKEPNSYPHSDQFGMPSLQQLVVYVAEDEPQTRMGRPVVTANSIRVEPGYSEYSFGSPFVSLRRRVITPAGILRKIEPGRPRVSPHTIYAVKEAPQQAIANHPSATPKYVADGEAFGLAEIQNKHRGVQVFYRYEESLIGRPKVNNARQYLLPEGKRMQQFGWVTIPGDQLVDAAHEDGAFPVAFGVATVAPPPYTGPRILAAQSAGAVIPPRPVVDFFHRTVTAKGISSLQMGKSEYQGGPPQQPYAWPYLRVGPLMPTIPKGISTEVFGETWVSLRIRGLAMEGFDAFLSEYDINKFKERMRVRNSIDDSASAPKPMGIAALGAVNTDAGTPTIWNRIQYIRPDGNSDQHRKGVIQ